LHRAAARPDLRLIGNLQKKKRKGKDWRGDMCWELEGPQGGVLFNHLHTKNGALT
jgi:hypothetical protein